MKSVVRFSRYMDSSDTAEQAVEALGIRSDRIYLGRAVSESFDHSASARMLDTDRLPLAMPLYDSFDCDEWRDYVTITGRDLDNGVVKPSVFRKWEERFGTVIDYDVLFAGTLALNEIESTDQREWMLVIGDDVLRMPTEAAAREHLDVLVSVGVNPSFRATILRAHAVSSYDVHVPDDVAVRVKITFQSVNKHESAPIGWLIATDGACD